MNPGEEGTMIATHTTKERSSGDQSGRASPMLFPTRRKTAPFTSHIAAVVRPAPAIVEGLPKTRRPAVNEAIGRSSGAKSLAGTRARSRDPSGFVA